MNDLETAKSIAAGDADAAERFVRDYYASVFRLMRHLTGHREDADDLTQQAFVVARGKIATYRGGASLKTWLHRVAFNEYAQWKRRRKRVLPLTSDRASEDPGYGSCILGQSLLEALGALPDKLREAVVLHEIEDLPVDEVANILRVPAGTVKARLFHARRKLRDLLDDEAEVNRIEKQEAVL